MPLGPYPTRTHRGSLEEALDAFDGRFVEFLPVASP